MPDIGEKIMKTMLKGAALLQGCLYLTVSAAAQAAELDLDVPDAITFTNQDLLDAAADGRGRLNPLILAFSPREKGLLLLRSPCTACLRSYL